MLATELIERLQRIVDDYGNVNVRVRNEDGAHLPIHDVSARQEKTHMTWQMRAVIQVGG